MAEDDKELHSLIKSFKTKDREKQESIAKTIAARYGADAIPTLAEVALRSKNPQRQLGLVDAMGLLTNELSTHPTAILALARLENVKDLEVSAAAKIVLDRLKEETETEPIVTAFRAVISETNDTISLKWVDETDEYTALRLLTIVREAQLDSQSQARVAIGLGKLKLTSAIDGLLELAHSSDAKVQKTSLVQLLHFSDPKIVEKLLPLVGKLKDEALEHTIQVLAAQGLNKDILALLRDSNWHIRFRAVEITRRIGDAAVIPQLLPLLDDNKSQIRRRVITTLGQLSDGQPEVTRLVGRRLRDSDPEVRKEAANALDHLADVSAAAYLVLAAEEEENEAIKGLVSATLTNLENKAPDRIGALKGLYDNENYLKAEKGLVGEGIAILPDIITLLDALNHNIRMSALRILSTLKDGTAVPAVCTKLEDEIVEVRKEAISTLVAIGSEEATDSLIEALNDQNIREGIVDALYQIGQVSKVRTAASQGKTDLIQAGACRILGLHKNSEAIALLESLLKDSSSLVREKAAEALGLIGDPAIAGSLASLLEDTAEDVQIASLKALGQLGQEASILPVLKHASKERNQAVLKAIRSTLIDIGKALNATELIDALITLLSPTDEEWHSQRSALEEKEASFPYLLKLAAKSPGSTMRWRAAEALASAKETFKTQSVEVLLKALNDSDSEVQLAAVKSLGILKATESLDSLIFTLQNEYLWEESINSLILIGETTPLMKPLEESEHSAVRLGICRVFGALTPQDGVPSLMMRLDDPERAICLAALDALGKIGSKKPIAAIIAMLTSRDKKERAKAAETLGLLRDSQPIPYLLDQEEDSSREIREASAEALRRLGEALELDNLIKAMRQLRSSDSALQEKGISTLSTFPEEQIVPLLVDWLQSPNSMTRTGTLLALGHIKWNETPESPITARLQDEASEVRMAALQALKNLGTTESFTQVLKCLEERNREIWSQAIQTTVAIRQRNPGTHSELISYLRSEHETVREGIAIIIRELESREDASKIIPLLSDLSEGVRIEAIRTLGSLGDVSVVPNLLDQIEVSKANIRKAAVEALGLLADLRATVPLLERAALDEDKSIQNAAEQALRQIGEPSGQQNMLEFLISLKSSDEKVRNDAISELASFEDSLPFLEQLLQSGSSEIRAGAAQAIGHLARDRKDITEELIKLLEDLSQNVRLGAIKGLGALGDPHAVVPLVGRLYEKNKEIWEQSIDALFQIGITSPLLPFLEDPNPKVREGVATAFSLMKESSTLPHLTAQLPDQEANVRAAVAFAIGELGLTDGTEPLLKALQDRDQTVRIRIIEALGKIGDSKAIFDVLEQEEESSKQISEAAFSTLAKIAEKNQMPALHALESLRSEDKAKQQQSIEELVEWGIQGAPWVTQALNSRNQRIRAGAVQVLTKLAYEPAVAKMAEMLKDDSVAVRYISSQAMGAFQYEPATSSLIHLLADKAEEVREKAILALTQIGPSTVPDLLKAIEDKNQIVRRGTCVVLGRIADPIASKKVSQRLSDKNDVRLAAIEALKQIGAECIPDLVEATKRKDVKARTGAVEAAGDIGKQTGDIQAIRLLEAALNDKKEEVREMAAKGLLEIGLPSVQSLCRALISHNTDTALKAAQTLRNLTEVMLEAGEISATRNLVGALKHKSAEVRTVAAEALGQLGDADAAVMPLLKAFGDKKAKVRLAAVQAVALLKDGRAVEPLERMLNDKDTNVRTAAVDALAKLQEAEVKRITLDSTEIEEIFQKRRRITGLVQRAQEMAAQEGIDEADLAQLKGQVLQATEELIEEAKQPAEPDRPISKCSSCGKEVMEGKRLCPECGAEEAKELDEQRTTLREAVKDFQERITALEDDWADGKISDEDYDQKEARLKKILARREQELKEIEEKLDEIT
ncbi:MAG: HEAT repeat domain-containing protein [Candidatus Thorarchaeota archaeon]